MRTNKKNKKTEQFATVQKNGKPNEPTNKVNNRKGGELQTQFHYHADTGVCGEREKVTVF